MNVSHEWLRSLVPGLSDSAERLADRLAAYGAPVDEVRPLAAGIGDVVVARVEAVEPHPNADRLSLCRVDAGTGDRLSVVCGAPNVRPGGYYPFAPVGASLPGDVKIRKAKIRGQASEGMLCSERELGLGRVHEGIMELAGEYTPGEPFVEALGLTDAVLVVDVTPNRPDLLSHIGIARELAPGGVGDLVLPPPANGTESVTPLPIRRGQGSATAGDVSLMIDADAACPRYIGVLIRGVQVGPSPDWLASRLRAVGVRPINNVVDATNHVLQELGQPLHAFDYDTLEGGEIVVRTARSGERLRTLDGVDRALGTGTLVIADAESPVAIAGVMGGEATEVGPDTRNVLLECALFERAAVRAGARGHTLSTDASYRFERGVDPAGLERAVGRAAALILATAGGEIDGAAEAWTETWTPPVVAVRPVRVARVLGVEIAAERITALLQPIGFEPLDSERDALRFRVPSYRAYDVEREVDLIEEVARRHGYEEFPQDMRPFRPTTVPDEPLDGLEERVRRLFEAHGFLEARTSPFAPGPEGEVELLLPLSSEESHLRAALLPGLLHRLEHNFRRGVRDVRLYEIGTAFADVPGERPAETTRVAAIFAGARTPPHWSGQPEAFDLWDAKGLLADLAETLGLAAGSVRPGSDPPAALAAERAFSLVPENGAVVGHGGLVRPAVLDAPRWAGDVWGLEVLLDERFARSPLHAYRAVPELPGTERDLALLVPEGLAAADIESLIRTTAGPRLESVGVFDVYRGEGLREGYGSIAYRLVFRAPDRTLTDEEVDRDVDNVLRTLREKLGVERR
ncbi:MAG: phenylalanine--tRNA ligase subunit beta [Longimicrobiales bacterium]